MSSFRSASARDAESITDSSKEFVVVSGGAVLLLADGHLELCSAHLGCDLLHMRSPYANLLLKVFKLA